MKKAIICVGCSASGKSTFASNLVNEGWVRIERDDIRIDILSQKIPDVDLHRVNMWDYWNWKWESEVTEIWNDRIDANSQLDKNIVISDTNLNQDKNKFLTSKLELLGYDVEFKFFYEPLDELWKRDSKRQHVVGRDVISKQHDTLVKNYPQYHIVNHKNLKDSVIFDIDGTIAHMNGKRGPFDWKDVGKDDPDKFLGIIISGLVQKNIQIIFMSGRDEVCRNETIKWIGDNFNIYESVHYKLFMRKQNDMRKDYVVKKELFLTNVNGFYNIMAVFDDRPQVCRLWQELGLKVLWCGNPYLEF